MEAESATLAYISNVTSVDTNLSSVTATQDLKKPAMAVATLVSNSVKG